MGSILQFNNISIETPLWWHQHNYMPTGIFVLLDITVSIRYWNEMLEHGNQQMFPLCGLVENRQMSKNCMWVHMLDDVLRWDTIDLGGKQWKCGGCECSIVQGCRHRGQDSGNTSAQTVSFVSGWVLLWISHYVTTICIDMLSKKVRMSVYLCFRAAASYLLVILESSQKMWFYEADMLKAMGLMLQCNICFLEHLRGDISPITWFIGSSSCSTQLCPFGSWNGMLTEGNQQLFLLCGLIENRQISENYMRGHILDDVEREHAIDLGGT